MNMEGEIEKLQAQRSCNIKAARLLLRGNDCSRHGSSLSMPSESDLQILKRYMKRITDIDKELQLKNYRANISQRLQMEKNAVTERKNIIDDCIPIMKEVHRHHKALKRSKRYNNFIKYTDKFAEVTDQADELYTYIDEVLRQPLSCSEEHFSEHQQIDSSILHEILPCDDNLSTCSKDTLRSTLSNINRCARIPSSESTSVTFSEKEIEFPAIPQTIEDGLKA